MAVTRRDTLKSGSAALLALGFPSSLQAEEVTAEQAIAAFVKGGEILQGGITLDLEDTAEDGFRVPVSVTAEGAEAILIVAPANPVPPIALVAFGALAADQQLSTRMRLARTQQVLALARMPDGTVRQVSKHVDVVVGGCGA
ncbi:thiosulfate oxidation carrier protein SoxY [Roseobacter cerasinus]|uniref:Thiosulfate oxidation carrier protein SoxY n=1 Tax=Roseobacter cerasinus TaxID=2602289 RepID=A0A640VYW1_9RHOB|nr:thiosulfate oxidation carrier protein SoxY [Roseobacter cerasinus]GFE52291.1 thiosulfate oxidation carrier protein SoxY [Roseobacter cerasinus]